MKTFINNLKMIVAICLGMAFAYLLSYVLLGHFVWHLPALLIGAMIGVTCRYLYIMMTDFSALGR